MSKTVVVYHGKCYDGFTAAWVAKGSITGEVELIPATYGEPIPDAVTNLGKEDTLYIVDFSYPRDILCKLHDQVGTMRVLDHHKTAQANCEGLDFCTFDMDRSGAGLTWDFFQPGSKRPKLVDYVEDRDLWRFKLPKAEEVHGYLSSWPMAFATWDAISTLLELNFEVVVACGEDILRYDNQKVEEMVAEAQHLVVAGYTVPVVNCPVQFGSKVGHRLLEIYPDAAFSAYYCDAADGTQRWGLRGRNSDDFDVSEIAKQFGGGGHKKASGFVKKGNSDRDVQSRN